MSASEIASAKTAGDWQLAEQTWRDWRSAIGRHYDQDVSQRLEQAWAAGLLDSEACFAIGNGAANGSGVSLQVRQAAGGQGHINLRRFQDAVGGAGVISGPEESGGALWHVWRAVGMEDIEKVWIAIGPFLGPARFAAFRDALVTQPEPRAVRSERGEHGRRKKKHAGRSERDRKVAADKEQKAGGSRTGTAH